MKGKNFIVPLVIYPFDIMFSIGQSDRGLMKILKKRLPKTAFDICKQDECLLSFNEMDNGRTLMIKDGGQTIIRVNKNPSHATIAHEIFHAISFLLIKLNMPLSLENDEAYAYLIGYVTEQFYKNIT